MINECTTETDGPSKLEYVIASLSTQLQQLHQGYEKTNIVIHGISDQLTALQEMAIQIKEQSNRVKKVESKTSMLETQIEALAERMNKFERGENLTAAQMNGSANVPNENLEIIHNDIGIIIETYKSETIGQNKSTTEASQNENVAVSVCTGGEIAKAVNSDESIIPTIEIEEDEREADREVEHGRDVMVKRNSLQSDSKRKAERDRIIMLEKCLLEHDHIIKANLRLTSIDVDCAIQTLNSYRAFKLTKLMLIKHPDVVQTMKRLRKYVGNTKNWQFTDDQIQEFNKKAATIRKLAESIYKSFQSLFVVPEGRDFLDIFNEEVRCFNQRVYNLTPEERILYVGDEDRS